MEDATRTLGQARAAHEAAADKLLRMFQLVFEAQTPERSALAPLLEKAQAEYDASRAALAEARAVVRRRA